MDSSSDDDIPNPLIDAHYFTSSDDDVDNYEGEKPAGFEGWCNSRKKAWIKRETNQNSYYYRYNEPNEQNKTGPWSDDEKDMFIRRLREVPHINKQWGLFAKGIPGRVGYQCACLYRKLFESGDLQRLVPDLDLINPNIRGKYQIIQQNDKNRIIQHYYDGKSTPMIADIMMINRNTVDSIIESHQSSANVANQTKVESRSHILTEEEKGAVKSWVDDDCSRSLSSLANECQNQFDKKVSVSTIQRVLEKFAFTMKRVHSQPVKRNTSSTIGDRFKYANAFMDHLTRCTYKDFIFIDEVGFQVTMRNKRGRSKKGTRAIQVIPSTRSRNISVCCAMTCERVLQHKVELSPFNGQSFVEFINGVINQIEGEGIKGAIFVFDNLSFHKSEDIRLMIENNGHKLQLLPPYSPFLNPIENMFSKWKQYVKSQKPKSEEELMRYIEEGIRTISAENCLSFFQHMMGYIARCIRKEPITD